MIAILQCLKKYGQRLDLEIAAELNVALATVRQRLTRLTASGEIIACSVTRFENGKGIDAWQCRVAGFVPPSGPGRKPKTTA
jgi:predicted ArsR family transcriptional regulator